MTDLIYDPESLKAGEHVFVLHGGMAPPSETIHGLLTINRIAPLDEETLRPQQFTGCEQRAGGLLELAHQRAWESGVRHIVVVDPYGLPRLAARGSGRR